MFLRGWAGYFRFGNSALILGQIRNYALTRLALWLSKRGKRRRAWGWGMTQILNSPNHLGLIRLDGIVVPPRPFRAWQSRTPPVKNVGKPCAGEPHARFDGRGLETEAIPATVEAKAARGKPQAGAPRPTAKPIATAPAPDPPRSRLVPCVRAVPLNTSPGIVAPVVRTEEAASSARCPSCLRRSLHLQPVRPSRAHAGVRPPTRSRTRRAPLRVLPGCPWL